jgi:TPR repeat protein
MVCTAQLALPNSLPKFKINAINMIPCETGDENACVQHAIDVFLAVEAFYDEAEFYSDAPPAELENALALSKACEKGSQTGCALKAFGTALKQKQAKADDPNADNRPVTNEIIQTMTKNLVLYCDKNSALACLAAGILTKRSADKENNIASEAMILKALTLSDKACIGGDKKMCHILGRLYQESEVIKNGSERAQNYFRLAIENECSTPTNCFEMGKKLNESRMLKPIYSIRNQGLITAFYTRACDAGEMRACTNLAIEIDGIYLYDGFGTVENANRAEQLFTKACNGGDMLGCLNLGIYTVIKNKDFKPNAHAVAAFTKACSDPKYRRACYIVGEAYYSGTGAPQNRELARTYYRKSCADQDKECLQVVERTGRAKTRSIDEIIGQTWH